MDRPMIIYGITKGGNLFTNKGILNDKFEKVDEKIEKKPAKVVFMCGHNKELFETEEGHFFEITSRNPTEKRCKKCGVKVKMGI